MAAEGAYFWRLKGERARKGSRREVGRRQGEEGLKGGGGRGGRLERVGNVYFWREKG